MKNKALNRIVSLVFIIAIMVSTTAISAVSTSAASLKATYTIEVSTSGSDGCTADMIYIKINGKDYSTDYHYCGHYGYRNSDTITFDDDNIGDVESITVKKAGFNGWYPNYFKVTKTVAGKSETTTIYGGKWVGDNEPITFSKNANVYKIDVETSAEDGAGTDSNVYIALIDKNGKQSSKLNASSVHPSSNAFEKADSASFYICVPDDFGKLDKVKFELGKWTAGADWKLEYFNVKKINGTEEDLNVLHSSTVNKVFKYGQYFAYSC